MVNTLLASMKMLWDVLILTMFFICIFALVGMQVFVGVLRNKCTEPGPENLQISYKDYASNPSEYFMFTIWWFPLKFSSSLEHILNNFKTDPLCSLYIVSALRKEKYSLPCHNIF